VGAVVLLAIAVLGVTLVSRGASSLGQALTGAADQGSPALPAGVVRVGPEIVRGEQLTESDLTRLRDDVGVKAVVNLGEQEPGARAAAQDLGLDYRELEFPPGHAPSPAQLGELMTLMRESGGEASPVYLRDAAGQGRAVVTTSMIQIIEGKSLNTVLAELPPGDRDRLTPKQITAMVILAEAISAPDPQAPQVQSNPYAPLREIAEAN
jgi:hypothetical protein